MINMNTKVSDMTLGELISAMEDIFAEKQPKRIYGINGLAEYLGCSVRNAQRLKTSGKIDSAMVQSGRTISFDEAKLRKLLKG